MVEYSYDPDDYHRRYDFRDDYREEAMIDAARRELEREIRRQEMANRPSGPSPRDLAMMREADLQMAAYLATNPDPITGLVREVINNPSVKLTKAQKDAINNPKKAMNSQGRIVKAPTGRQVIRSSGQFRSTGIPLPGKRTRKKTKMDRTMSKCLKMANAKLRNKNGKLKKGKTMRDVMKMAHRLCRKHG